MNTLNIWGARCTCPHQQSWAYSSPVCSDYVTAAWGSVYCCPVTKSDTPTMCSILSRATRLCISVHCIICISFNHGRKGQTWFRSSKRHPRWNHPEVAEAPETSHGVQYQPAPEAWVSSFTWKRRCARTGGYSTSVDLILIIIITIKAAQ